MARCTSPRVFVFMALVVMSPCLPSPVLAVPIHDPVADYDAGWLAGTNPNGVWTYGWSSMLTSSLTLYSRNRTTTQDCPGSTYRAWDDPANNFGFTPSVIKNIGPDCSNGNVDIPSGVMTLHFGGLSGSDYSHIVFTAPSDADYLLDVTFTGRQNAVNSDVHILANGNSLLSDLITGNLQTKHFTGTVFLMAGQTIDFAVGPGTSPGLHPGHIGLSGTIQTADTDQCTLQLSQCQADLAAADEEILDLQNQLASANNTIATQNAQIAQLQSALATANATVNSLVLRVFGEPPDAHAAQAARDVAAAALQDAITAVGATDRRVQQAQRNFNEGLAALAAGEYGRAIREFDQTFTIAQRILN